MKSHIIFGSINVIGGYSMKSGCIIRENQTIIDVIPGVFLHACTLAQPIRTATDKQTANSGKGIIKTCRSIPGRWCSMAILIAFFSVILAASIAPTCASTVINFTTPTPQNGTSQSETNVDVNVSIIEANLEDIIYNWNGTNYTMYNDSLVLIYNFDNITAIGENYIRNQVDGVVDISKYGNNGTLGNATAGTDPTWISSGKNGGAFEFDGTNDYISSPTSIL